MSSNQSPNPEPNQTGGLLNENTHTQISPDIMAFIQNYISNPANGHQGQGEAPIPIAGQQPQNLPQTPSQQFHEQTPLLRPQNPYPQMHAAPSNPYDSPVRRPVSQGLGYSNPTPSNLSSQNPYSQLDGYDSPDAVNHRNRERVRDAEQVVMIPPDPYNRFFDFDNISWQKDLRMLNRNISEADRRKHVEMHNAPWITPSTAYDKDPHLKLHNELVEFSIYVQPSIKSVQIREDSFKIMRQHVRTLENNSSIKFTLTGSTVTKLYLPNASVDVIMSEEFGLLDFKNNRDNRLDLIKRMVRLLNGMKEVRNLKLRTAKDQVTPVLTFKHSPIANFHLNLDFGRLQASRPAQSPVIDEDAEPKPLGEHDFIDELRAQTSQTPWKHMKQHYDKLYGMETEVSYRIFFPKDPDHMEHDFDVQGKMPTGPEADREIMEGLKAHPEAKPLMFLFKLFLRQRDFDDVYAGGFNSYILFGLIVAFMKYHKSKVVEKRGREAVHTVLLSEYLLGFLDHYGNRFDTKKDRIIIGGIHPFAEKSTELPGLCVTRGDDPETSDLTAAAYAYREIFNCWKNRYVFLTNFNFHPEESILKALINPAQDDFEKFLSQQPCL